MPIKAEVLDLHAFLNPDSMASEIARRWQEWDSLRDGWKREKIELRNYLYATDTSTTSVSTLPWLNKTTLPKLTQIYDNLKANYDAALFPQEKWLEFDPGSRVELSRVKSETVTEYLLTKLRQDNFRVTADALIDDYIQAGNCFATVEWADDWFVLNEGTALEEIVTRYVGPRIVRISPYDIVFNPTAARWKDTPKIIRSIVTLGTLEKMGIREEITSAIHNSRRLVGSGVEVQKGEAFVADGFSSIEHYYGSGYVELLTFYGDIYDHASEKFLSRQKIVVADRAHIVTQEQFPSWLGEDAVFHAGWRSRPDNLYAMGPLDNLVGMQYRIDHLENLKADVFDQVAVPMIKVKGDVEDFEQQPGERIILGEEGDVAYLSPDVTALQSDNQIAYALNVMEEFAGAPRQAMGIRTPGEKTAFEVQTLADSASRIFQHKAAKFEIEFFEPILNAMLESAQRNMDTTDLISVFDDTVKIKVFKDITRDDITVSGKLRPVGARHFAEKNRRIQNLNNMMEIKLRDPSVAPHISGKEIARILTNELGESQVFKENVAIEEQLETMEVAQDGEAENMANLAEKADLGE